MILYNAVHICNNKILIILANYSITLVHKDAVLFF